ncbi:MAG: hypothetical protein PUC12_17390 [Clostridiales bacterium]|nr:hypothetical protein [Clostridiales bacterium]
MRLNTKKMIAALGVILFVGASAITAQAYTYCSFSTSNGEVTAYANGNINKSVFTYAGSRTAASYTKYVPARMWVTRAFYSKAYENGTALGTKVYSKQRSASKKDEQGIKITIKTYDTDGRTVTSSNSRIIRCN